MAPAGKKRNAKAQVNPKPAKAIRKQDEMYDTKSNNDLFDNLDEEMDPEEVEDYMHQLEENEESGQEDLLDQASVEEEEEEEEQRGEKNKEEEQMSTPSEQQSVAKRFRDAYMAKVTQAFGSDLDQIRQEPTLDGPRLNILIDSLEAGIDIFSSLEQEIEL